jgi:hypothetical protein
MNDPVDEIDVGSDESGKFAEPHAAVGEHDDCIAVGLVGGGDHEFDLSDAKHAWHEALARLLPGQVVRRAADLLIDGWTEDPEGPLTPAHDFYFSRLAGTVPRLDRPEAERVGALEPRMCSARHDTLDPIEAATGVSERDRHAFARQHRRIDGAPRRRRPPG